MEAQIVLATGRAALSLCAWPRCGGAVSGGEDHLAATLGHAHDVGARVTACPLPWCLGDACVCILAIGRVHAGVPVQRVVRELRVVSGCLSWHTGCNTTRFRSLHCVTAVACESEPRHTVLANLVLNDAL